MSFKFPNGEFNRFVIFKDYGSEGWKIYAQTDDAQVAIDMRDEALGCGGGQAVIFRPAEFSMYVVNKE